MAPVAGFLGLSLTPRELHAVVQSASGELIAAGGRQLSVDDSDPETDPEDWWRLVRTTVKDLLRRNQIDAADIRAVGLTATSEGVVLLDSQGKVLCPAVLGNDPRLATVAEEVIARFGVRNLRNLTGRSASASSVITKLVWLQREAARAWHDCAQILQPADFLRLRLTDQRVTDPSTACRSLLFNPKARQWSKRVLDQLGLDPAWLPEIAGGTQIIGRVTTTAARQCGLQAGTPVVGGANAVSAAAVALGVTEAGHVALQMGGIGFALTIAEESVRDSSGATDLACHCLNGMWANEAADVVSDAGVSWLRRSVLAEELERARRSKRSPAEHLAGLAADAAPGADGLRFISPRHPNGGGWWGLRPHHQRSHMARAVMESAAYNARAFIDHIADLGVPAHKLSALGDLAENDLWCQLIADCCDLPLTRVADRDLSARGVAALACVATGSRKDITAACKRLGTGRDRFRPRTAAVRSYLPVIESYRQLHSNLDNETLVTTTTAGSA